MVKGCCVYGCTANSRSNKDRGFYIIPKEESRRKRWLEAINRPHINEDGSANVSKLWSPTSKHVYVCSAHFVTGKKVNDPCHPDFVPSLFPPTENTNSSDKVYRYKRAIKRHNADSDIQRATTRKKMKQQSPDFNHRNTQYHSYHQMSPDDYDPESASFPDDIDLYEDSNSDTSEQEMLYNEINNQNEFLERVVQRHGSANSFHSSSVEGNAEKCEMMTGISWEVFIHLHNFLSTSKTYSSASALPIREQLFLTLVKLRHNLTFEFIAYIKGIPKTTMLDYFWTWVDLMYDKLNFLIRWTDHEITHKTIPTVFKEKFPRLTSIIDCYEIFIETPTNVLERAQCYSRYKRHTSIKCFISCNPYGAVNFISKCWGGRTSDIEVVRRSGFISAEYHSPGDQILANRDFTLTDDFAETCSAELITPAFINGTKQLSAQEFERFMKVSSVRIHIDCVIGCMKSRFSILKGTLPVHCVQSFNNENLEETFSSCDQILTVCAALSNLGPSIVFQE